MGLQDRFNRAAAPARPVPAASRRRSKYAGVSAASEKHPDPNPGTYKFLILETLELTGNGENFKATLEVLESDRPEASPAGTVVKFMQSTSGKAERPGTARVKRFVMSAANIEDETAYDAFDPNGFFLDACGGVASEDFEADPLRGRVVYAEVFNGKPRADGSDWKDFTWYAADDSEQPQAAAQ